VHVRFVSLQHCPIIVPIRLLEKHLRWCPPVLRFLCVYGKFGDHKSGVLYFKTIAFYPTYLNYSTTQKGFFFPILLGNFADSSVLNSLWPKKQIGFILFSRKCFHETLIICWKYFGLRPIVIISRKTMNSNIFKAQSKRALFICWR